MTNRCLALLTTATLLTSCSTMSESLVLGGGVGATFGGAIGHASGKDAKSTAIGAAVGAAAGALIGYFGHKDEKKKQQEREAQRNANQGKPKYPTVSAPQVRAVWVPDRIENDQYVSGHYIYVIDKPATFRQE